MTLLYLLPLLILVWILISLVLKSLKNGIAPMPSSPKAIQCVISLLPPDASTVYELGSGWGTLAFPIARKLQNCRVIGYENSLLPYLFSKMRFMFSPLPNLEFHLKDFYSVQLSNASLIICYLFPDAMRQLKEKFEKELKPGTLVISNTFAVPLWKPLKTKRVPDIYGTHVYLYEKKG